MYWEGGALLLTLSGQSCARTIRSHITFAASGCRPALHPIPDHSSDVAGSPCVRGWRRNPTGSSGVVPSLEVPSRPGSTSSLRRTTAMMVACPAPG